MSVSRMTSGTGFAVPPQGGVEHPAISTARRKTDDRVANGLGYFMVRDPSMRIFMTEPILYLW
jgi:hypothetical protein